MNLQIGSKIYYTGDICNSRGHFEVVATTPSALMLQELPGGDGRTFHVYPSQVGSVYQGHCNPRFVTEEARQAFLKARGL